MQFQVMSVSRQLVKVCAHCHGEGGGGPECEDAGTEDEVMVSVDLVMIDDGPFSGILKMQFPEDECGGRFEPGDIFEADLVRSTKGEKD